MTALSVRGDAKIWVQTLVRPGTAVDTRQYDRGAAARNASREFRMYLWHI